MRVVFKAALVSALVLLCAPLSAKGQEIPVRDARFSKLVQIAKSAMMVDPAFAIKRAKDAYVLAENTPDPQRGTMMRATALWLLGEAATRLNSPKRAVALLTTAERLVVRSDRKSLLHADVLLSLGAAQTDVGRVAESLSSLQRAHTLYRSLHQPREQAKALIFIAFLYSSARDNESALRYFQQAIETRVADNAIAISLYNGRGTTLTRLGQLDEAELSFERALYLARQMHSDTLQAISLANLATVQLQSRHLAAAQRSITSGLSLSMRDSAQASRPDYVTLSARLASQRGDLDAGVRLITKRFEGVNIGTTNLNDRDAHQVAYDIYNLAGKPALALAHLAALKRLDDKATEIARSNSAALAAAKFDYTNQELRIAKLKADDLQKTVAFERSSARTQRMIFVGAAIATSLVMTLLVIGLFAIRRSRNQTRLANSELETTNGALNKALAAKTEFLATTSHEIRTPLNGILGMTQVMAADPALNDDMRDRVSVVHGAGVTMRALVDDILDVAKIESGKMTIEEAPLDLAATVSDATRLWRDQAADKGLTMTVDAGESAWIMGDVGRLRQIVFNLLSNAVKFTAAGQVRVTSVIREERAMIVVEDTGIGIDPSAHEMIFELFRQADATTTRQFGGTGLGLSICRNLARAMGGDVTVNSRLGAGATFTLDLPVRAVEHSIEAKKIDVVIVERNPIARATLRALLEPHGPVAFVTNLLEAEALVRSGKVETLLVDYGSVAGDTGAVAAVAARSGTRTILLLAADTPEIVPTTGVVTVRRPIGKQSLVARVFYPNKTLVRDAA